MQRRRKQVRGRHGAYAAVALAILVTVVPDLAIGAAPPKPSPIWPGNPSEPGEEISDLTPTLSWSSVEGADNYHVAVRRYEGSWSDGPIVATGEYVRATSYTISDGKLESGERYRWNVEAFNSDGVSSGWSTKFYFRVEADPDESASLPDFHILALEVDPPSPVEGDEVTISCTYNNGGDGPAPSGYSVVIGIDDDLREMERNGPALNVAAQRSEERTMTAPQAGSHDAFCYVNENNEVDETHGDNWDSSLTSELEVLEAESKQNTRESEPEDRESGAETEEQSSGSESEDQYGGEESDDESSEDDPEDRASGAGSDEQSRGDESEDGEGGTEPEERNNGATEGTFAPGAGDGDVPNNNPFVPTTHAADSSREQPVPGGWVWPATGQVVSDFFDCRPLVPVGCTDRHKGLDIDGRLFDPVYATTAGTLTAGCYSTTVEPGQSATYGCYLVLRHADGLYSSRYAHLCDWTWEPRPTVGLGSGGQWGPTDLGVTVAQGEKIGEMGNSGLVREPCNGARGSGGNHEHLHFQVEYELGAMPLPLCSETMRKDNEPMGCGLPATHPEAIRPNDHLLYLPGCDGENDGEGRPVHDLNCRPTDTVGANVPLPASPSSGMNAFQAPQPTLPWMAASIAVAAFAAAKMSRRRS